MPEFVKSGRLGRVVPPLYKLEKGKNYKYFYSEEEYQQEKDKYSNWETTRFKG